MSENDQTSRGVDAEQPPKGIEALKNHIIQNKWDCALWLSRVLTIIFTIGYILPIFTNAQSAYKKVLVANAATSALRLHQRLPRVTLSREFLNKLLAEDSFHYLFFSMIFLYVQSTVLVLLPVVLFAILHSASYSLTLLDTIGQNSWWGARFLISLVELQTRNILRLAAFAEIQLMPICILFVVIGGAGFMTPFIYYHFLFLRYSSRRNPYTRNMFYELRLAVESLANNQICPNIIRKMLRLSISFISRLAPVIQTAPQN